jgi:hypothetical protein
MAKRLVDHAVDKDTNVRLINAINKYGLGNFTFAVVEIFKVDPDVSMETNKAGLLAPPRFFFFYLFVNKQIKKGSAFGGHLTPCGGG